MSVKLALLKSGENVISDVKELISDDKICGYLLKDPHVVEIRKAVLLAEEYSEDSGELEVSLSPWIVLTSDLEIPVPPDWIVTIVEPIDTIKEMYEEKVNGKNSEVPSSELGEPDCKLINPYEIDAEGNLVPWPEVTDQKELMIHSDSILTIVDPKPEIIEKYLALT